MRYLEDVKEMLCQELETYAKKGELTAGSLDVIDKLTHALKSVETIMAMEDSSYADGGSYRGSYDGGSYRGSYDGGSYRRGRSATTGRFVSRYSGRGYSRDDGMREKLEALMEDAPDDHTRQELQRLIDKM